MAARGRTGYQTCRCCSARPTPAPGLRPGDGWTEYQPETCCCCFARPAPAARPGGDGRTDCTTGCSCLARLASAALYCPAWWRHTDGLPDRLLLTRTGPARPSRPAPDRHGPMVITSHGVGQPAAEPLSLLLLQQEPAAAASLGSAPDGLLSRAGRPGLFSRLSPLPGRLARSPLPVVSSPGPAARSPLPVVSSPGPI